MTRTADAIMFSFELVEWHDGRIKGFKVSRARSLAHKTWTSELNMTTSAVHVMRAEYNLYVKSLVWWAEWDLLDNVEITKIESLLH